MDSIIQDSKVLGHRLKVLKGLHTSIKLSKIFLLCYVLMIRS
jgi:hypothetical protein